MMNITFIPLVNIIASDTVYTAFFAYLFFFTCLYLCIKDKESLLLCSIPLLILFLLSLAQLYEIPWGLWLHNKIQSMTTTAYFFAASAIPCLFILLFRSPHRNKQPTYAGCDERQREKLLNSNQKILFNDFSSLKRNLITLATSCIVFSSTFLSRSDITDAVRFAWTCWTLCIIFCFISTCYSILSNMRLCSQLRDLRISANEIHEPSDAKELAFILYAALCFLTAVFVLCTSIVCNTGDAPSPKSEPKALHEKLRPGILPLHLPETMSPPPTAPITLSLSDYHP